MKSFIRILPGLLAFLVAAVIAVIVFYRSGVQNPQEQILSPTASETTMFPQASASCSDTSELMRALSADYPEEAAQLQLLVSQMPADATQGDLEALTGDFMRAFAARERSALAAAPDNALLAVIRADGQVVHHLQRLDVRLCAEHVTVGLSPSTRFSQETLDVLSVSAAARIHAARAGEETPESRPGASEADLAAPGYSNDERWRRSQRLRRSRGWSDRR